MKLYEENIASNNKFVLLHQELEGGIPVLTTEDDMLWIPPSWGHATLDVTSSLTPGLQLHTSKSLMSSAALLELDLRTLERISEENLTLLL